MTDERVRRCCGSKLAVRYRVLLGRPASGSLALCSSGVLIVVLNPQRETGDRHEPPIPICLGRAACDATASDLCGPEGSSFSSPRRKRWSRRLTALMFLVASAGASVTVAPPAFASGPKQVSFYCASIDGSRESRVNGWNQNGDLVRWSRVTNSQTILTAGWWWVGTVTIQFQNRSGVWQTYKAPIPTGANGSTAYFRCT